DFPPSVDGPWMHNNDVRLSEFHMFGAQAKELEIFVSRKCRFVLTLQLNTQHHDDVDVPNCLLHIAGQFNAGRDLSHFPWKKRSRAAQNNLNTEFRKKKNIGSCNTAVRDVADDRNAQTFQAASSIDDGEGVEQRLSRMLVCP